MLSMATAEHDCPETKPFLDSGEKSQPKNASSAGEENLQWRQAAPWGLHFLVIVIYSIAYVITTGTSVKHTTHTTPLYPIDGIRIQYIPQAYDDFKQSPWAGLPSPSIDTAWHHLLEGTTIRVTAEELARSSQSSVEFPQGGGYMAWLGVFHELHCIKMVRQWVYHDYYHPNITEVEVEEWSIHADHCLDILRSAALCHADTTLTTFGWGNKSKPMLNTRPIAHKCVNWGTLMDSVKHRVVGRDEMAGLVNPLLEHP